MKISEINYTTAVNYLQINGETTLKTLGGLKEIKFGLIEGKLLITNSNNTVLTADEVFFNKVLGKIKSLDLNLRTKGSSYTINNWKIGNPNTVFAPYLVSLYFHLLQESTKNISNRVEFENKYHFRKIGEFVIENGIPTRRLDPSIKITDRLDLVYAFFVNDQCKYIGKTIQGYSRPTGYHKNTVMKTANHGILQCLNNNITVDIFVRSNNVSIEFEGLKLNIIEPIEQALISLYNPEWNNLVH
jgi:hypothetical protein